MKKIVIIVMVIIGLGLIFSDTDAATVNFSWGVSSGQVDGYKIYQGSASGQYDHSTLVEYVCSDGKCTGQIDGFIEGTYYLVCVAYNRYGDSGYSNEVVKNIPDLPPGKVLGVTCE